MDVEEAGDEREREAGAPALKSAAVPAVDAVTGHGMAAFQPQLRRTGYNRLEHYGKGRVLGVGGFGKVDPETGQEVAIKRIISGGINLGLHPAALREVKVLQELANDPHPNIIQLLDLMFHKGRICLVFELCTTDLEAVLHDRSIMMTPGHIKAYMQMLLRGLAYMHGKGILHRDIKPNNMLVGTDGQLKLTDFGLAKPEATPGRKLTAQVVTRWYRAPELLLGAPRYGPAVDIWAAGCVFAELLRREPLFPGDSELQQLQLILSVMGPPDDDQWPGLRFLPVPSAVGGQRRSLASVLPPATPKDAVDLLGKMLTYDPLARISAADALRHPYFTNFPQPTPPERLPRTAASTADVQRQGALAHSPDHHGGRAGARGKVGVDAGAAETKASEGGAPAVHEWQPAPEAPPPDLIASDDEAAEEDGVAGGAAPVVAAAAAAAAAGTGGGGAGGDAGTGRTRRGRVAIKLRFD